MVPGDIRLMPIFAGVFAGEGASNEEMTLEVVMFGAFDRNFEYSHSTNITGQRTAQR